MATPTDRKYTESHEWLLPVADKAARVGITDFAQSELGDIVYIDLPEVGSTVTADASFGYVESVKTVSELLSPVTGVITAVNTAAVDAPESVNSAPYETWFIEVSEISAEGALLDAAAYEATL